MRDHNNNKMKVQKLMCKDPPREMHNLSNVDFVKVKVVAKHR